MLVHRTPAPAIVLALAATLATVAAGPATPGASAQAPTTRTTQANPAPPGATTGAAGSLSRTGATVTGTVTPGLAETTYHFEYGTSTSYGLTTPTATVPAGSAAVAVQATLSGLTVATTYHYRVVATNPAGTTRGADRSFKTLSNPRAPTVSTSAATNVGPQQATLVGRVNPQGQATTYYFQYGTSTKYASRTASVSAGASTSTATVQATITGLPANTKYNFRVVAVNATGTTRGSNRTVTTTRGLTGVAIGAARSRVVWNTPASIQGTVAGQKTGAVKVVLLRQDFPFTGPLVQVATQTTSSAGAYDFTTGPLYVATRFQVTTATTPALASAVLTIRSRLLTKLWISTKRSTAMTLRGSVYPVVPKGRTSVQRRTPKGRWIRVKRATLRHDTTANRSSYTVSVPRLTRTARYRVVVLPRDGGAHVTTNSKSVLVARRR